MSVTFLSYIYTYAVGYDLRFGESCLIFRVEFIEEYAQSTLRSYLLESTRRSYLLEFTRRSYLLESFRRSYIFKSCHTKSIEHYILTHL